MDHFPAQLSGGQTTAGSTCPGIGNRPDLLLADEPTGALDLATGRQILRLLQDLRSEGRTVVVVTHNASVAQIADRVVTMVDGQVRIGTPQRVPGRRRRRGVVMAMRALTHKALRDLRRQLAQVIAVGFTVMLGVALFIASGGAYQNLSSSYEYTYDRLHFADLIATGGDPLAVAAARHRGRRHRRHHPYPGRSANGDYGYEVLGRVIGLPATRWPAVDGCGRHRRRLPELGRHTGGYWSSGTPPKRSTSPRGPAAGVHRHGWQDRTVRGIVVSPEYIWPGRSRQDVLTDPHSFRRVRLPAAVRQWFGTHPTRC